MATHPNATRRHGIRGFPARKRGCVSRVSHKCAQYQEAKLPRIARIFRIRILHPRHPRNPRSPSSVHFRLFRVSILPSFVTIRGRPSCFSTHTSKSHTLTRNSRVSSWKMRLCQSCFTQLRTRKKRQATADFADVTGQDCSSVPSAKSVVAFRPTSCFCLFIFRALPCVPWFPLFIRDDSSDSWSPPFFMARPQRLDRAHCN